MYIWIINNYQLGAKLNITPIEKIVSKNRINKNHIEIIYNNLSEKEIQLCEKCFCKKVTIR